MKKLNKKNNTQLYFDGNLICTRPKTVHIHQNLDWFEKLLDFLDYGAWYEDCSDKDCPMKRV